MPDGHLVARPSLKISDETWAMMQQLPQWALFHDDVVEVWNEVAAGRPTTNADRIIAEVVATLRFRDDQRAKNG